MLVPMVVEQTGHGEAPLPRGVTLARLRRSTRGIDRAVHSEQVQ